MVAQVTDDTPLERQESFKELRARNKFRAEQIKAQHLDSLEKQSKSRQLREWWNTDWVSPYIDAVRTAYGGMSPFGVTGQWQRQQGRNFPLYRTEQELALLRFPSRWLCSTNSYAIGFLNGLAGYMLGSGLTYRVSVKEKNDVDAKDDTVKALQEIVDNILDANEWYGGELPGFEEEYFVRTLEDGEAIALHSVGDDGIAQYRFADPEQLVQPPSSDFAEWGLGVFVDPDDVERPLKYNIAWDESKTDCEEFDAEMVTHFRRNVKRSSKRGVPDFSFSTYESLDAAIKLQGNMGEAAAQQAAIVSVMKFKSGSQEEIQAVATGTDFYDFNPYSGQQIGVRKSRKGTNEYIPDSQEYTSGPAASNATAHAEVLKLLLRSAGTRWNAPDWLGTSDASGNTFANADAALSTFINTVLRNQRRYTAAYKRMIWWGVEQYLAKKSVSGLSWEQVEAEYKLCVEAPHPVTKNPLADAQVAAIEIPLGVQSRQSYMQEMGRDAKQIEADNMQWENDHGGVDPVTGQKMVNDEPGNDSQDNSMQAVYESFEESKHPRGNSKNRGQFSAKGTTKSEKSVNKNYKGKNVAKSAESEFYPGNQNGEEQGYVWRVQPIGSNLHDVKSMDSNDEEIIGVFVFETLNEVAAIDWMDQKDVELVKIKIDKGDLFKTYDQEGVGLKSGKGEIVARKPFESVRDVRDWAIEGNRNGWKQP